jgi:RNA polymerase sigma-70 factor (ECF subfamily)
VTPEEQLVETVRTEGARVLATLVRTVGDLGLAEDALQEATIAALRTWPRDGVPDSPRAWLTTTARRKALDVIRRESLRPVKEAAVAWPDESPEPQVDLLRLLFTCCHPALALDVQVALALRTLCGLDTEEISRLLLVPEPTLAKRLVRARRKIADARIPYRVPPPAELPARLAGVLAVVHLLFTQGLERPALQDEALRLARLVHELMPDESSVLGLLALVLLTRARTGGRLVGGELVELPDQDRSGWDHDLVREGAALALRALRRAGARPGTYELQAVIAGCHATAPTWESTDWDTILTAYDRLLEVTGSPVVRLNRAVAVAQRHGPAAGLLALDEVVGLDQVHHLHAVRGRLLRQLGDEQGAERSLRAALALRPSPAERRLLDRLLRG